MSSYGYELSRAGQDAQVPQSSPEGRFPAGGYVLVADDNALNAKLLRIALEARGYTVCVVTDGIAALAAIRHAVPQVALLDIQMPHMDGIALLEQLRRDDDTRRLPIVVISAFAAGGDLDRAYEAGADTFLSKPVQIRRLLDLVDRLVGYRSDEPTTKATA